MSDDVSSFSPLRETSFFILLSLAGGDRHGYRIMKETSELSNGRIELSTGTLYGALKRLLEDGLVMRLGEKEVGGRVRVNYRLTERGRRVLDAEMRRYSSMAKLASMRLAREGS